jgi:hypothetical protein
MYQLPVPPPEFQAGPERPLTEREIHDRFFRDVFEEIFGQTSEPDAKRKGGKK